MVGRQEPEHLPFRIEIVPENKAPSFRRSCGDALLGEVQDRERTLRPMGNGQELLARGRVAEFDGAVTRGGKEPVPVG